MSSQQHSRVEVIIDGASGSDREDAAETPQPAHRNSRPRRSEGDVRNAYLSQGAMLLKFDVLPSTNDTVSGDVVSAWRRIERFGFIVLADTGCMIPHEQFRPHVGSSGLRLGHVCAAAFFHGVRIDYAKEKGKRNELGWPTDMQLSHLCHTAGCCNPKHLFEEPRWKNVKRNFCGIAGQCDCGMQPPCVRVYTPARASVRREVLGVNEPRLGKTLRRFVGAVKSGEAAAAEADSPDAAADDEATTRYTVQVLPPDFYVTEDLHRQNRLSRHRKQKKHEAETARNKAKSAARTGAKKKKSE